MKSARDFYQDAVAMHEKGAKPFQIVRRVLTDAGADQVKLHGTLRDSRLVFSSGEAITYDGAAWRYEAAPAHQTGKDSKSSSGSP